MLLNFLNFAEIRKKLKIKECNFLTKIEIAELCKGGYCVDLDESFSTHIYLQNLASIQPRTSPLKFARSAAARRTCPRLQRLHAAEQAPSEDSPHMLPNVIPGFQSLRTNSQWMRMNQFSMNWTNSQWFFKLSLWSFEKIKSIWDAQKHQKWESAASRAAVEQSFRTALIRSRYYTGNHVLHRPSFPGNV